MEPLSTVGQRLRSPVTWGSAAATLAGLYGLYQYQYQRQLARQRTSGRPDLGGPFSLLDPDGKPVCSGVKCTGFVAIKDDVVNAGGVWCDEAVVNDRNIITSRTPHDLTPFCKALIAAIAGLK